MGRDNPCYQERTTWTTGRTFIPSAAIPKRNNRVTDMTVNLPAEYSLAIAVRL